MQKGKSSQKSFIRPLSSTLIAAILCMTLGIQTFIFHAPTAEAAAISWTAGSGNWSTASNWSGNAVPTSSDDVTINRAGGATITADTNISFSTLTIGGAGDSNILLLTNNITTGGSITIGSSGSLIQKNFTAQTITGTLTINSGGILQHEENTTTEAYKVDITAATITINSGGTVDVNARGYQGDQGFKGHTNVGGEGHNGHGTGKGLNGNLVAFNSGSGAGHGGAGGANNDSTPEAGGAAYCTGTNPATIGSGGGGSGNSPTAGKGGDGGGLIRLTSTGNITIAGSILANGGAGEEDGGNDGGGGSGGGIYIYGGAITANTGTVEAKGGAAGNGNSGGGGGGGCIFYSYTSNAYASFPHSETGGVGINNGSAGTYNTTQRTPTVAFSSATGDSLESANGTVTVNLSSSTGSDVTVHYSVAGTATQGTDYTALTGKLTIASGSTSGTITLTTTNDTTDEANETVILTLYNPTNATLGATTAITHTINDDDAGPTVQFTATTSSDSEGRTAALISATLSEISTNNVTVDYAVSGTATGSGTDFTLANGTLTIEAGKTTKNIPVVVVDDSLIETTDETIILTLSNAANATLGANTVHTYTLKDNDGTPTVGFVLTNSEVSEATGSASIGVQLSRTPAGSQSVDVTYTISGGTAVSGTNYTLLASGTIPLPNTTVVNISPTIIADADAINQTLILTLSSPVNANLGVNTVHTLTIRETTVTSSTPTKATVNGIPTPATVATNNPVLSWKFTPSVTNDSQTGYRVVFATSEANLTAGTYSCDSGVTTSNKSVNNYSNLCSGNTLAAGTYYWKVLTYNSSNTASSYTAAQTLIVSSVITAPTTCTTASTTRSSFTLGWTDNASNETGYEIEQSLVTYSGMSMVSNGTYRRITTTAANAVTYDVTGLTPSTPYFFRVRAINNTGTSAYLTCSSITTLATTPNAPALAPLSTTSINVVIDPTANSTFATYAIQVNGAFHVQTDGTLSALAVWKSQSEWGSRGKAVTGLTANTAYVVSIIARNGNSIDTSASTTATIYTLAEKVIISTSSPAASSFYVAVDVNGNPSGTLTSMTINDVTQTRYIQANGTTSHLEVKQTPATWGSLQITNLATNTNHRLQAISYNGDNVPTYSFTAAQITTASAPTSFRLTSLTSSTYAVSVDTQSGYQYNFNSLGLQAGNTYSGAISSADGIAEKTVKLNNGSDTATVTMGICVGATTPGTLTIDNSATTATSIKLAIDASTNGSSIEYQVHDIISNTYLTKYGTLVSTPTWDTKANLGGDSGITITGLTSGGDYEFRARARNCRNIETAFTGTTRIAEIPAKVPAAPTVTILSDSNGVSAARIYIDTTGFSESALATNEFAIYNATTNQYVANAQGATTGNGALGSSAAWNIYESWGAGGGFPIYNLASNVTHQFAIKARKTVNSVAVETGFSPKTALVLGVNKPLASVRAITSSTIALQINPLSNSIENTNYLIELVGDSSSTHLLNTGANNTFGSAESWTSLSTWDGNDGTSDGLVTISGLSPNTPYTLRIKARNSDLAAGYVAPTTTIYTAAALPTSFSASAASTTRINLSWNVASNPAGTEYRITNADETLYVTTSHTLGATSAWSSWDNTTPTNAWYVDGLSASTNYCFKIQARNIYLEETAFTSTACATTSTAAASSSGGGGGSSAATTTTTTTTTPTPVTTDTTPPVTTTTDTTPPKTTTTTTTPTPVTTPTTTTDSSSTSGGGGGGGSSSSSSFNAELEKLKQEQEKAKEIQAIEKQKEEGYITFLDKKVAVPGVVKAGITRDQFIAALISDVPFEKAYEPPTAKAIKQEVTTIIKTGDDQYIKIDKAIKAIQAALNMTDVEVCLYLKECNLELKDDLVKEKQEYMFGNARNYLNDQMTKRNQTIDTDKDGILDHIEVSKYGTNPKMADTDGDLAFDGDEIFKFKTDPLVADTDLDGLSDGEEFKKTKTSPLLRDTDGDGWNDKEDTAPKDPLVPGQRQKESGIEDSDGDGLSNREEQDLGTNPNNADSDGDGIKDGQEIAAGTNPNKFETELKEPELTCTNLQSGMKTPDSPPIRGGAKAGSTITIYARNNLGLMKKVGEGVAQENNLYMIQPRSLPDGEFYFQAVDTEGKSCKPIRIIIDRSLRLRSPELLRFNNQDINQDDIARSKTEDISDYISNSVPTFEFRTETGARTILTTKSAISTAVLISDSPSGIIEMRPPEELEIGDHEIIAYSVKDDGNIVSQATTFRFRVTEASSYSDEQYRIKSRDSGNLLAFFREKSVKPLFTKIFIGVGAVLVIWALVSIYQKRKRDEDSGSKP